MRILFAVASLAFAVACGSSPTSPSLERSLRLTVSISRSVVPAGETATITYRLQNVGPSAQTLHFSDSCQLLPYISSGYGLIMYPEGGSWMCATAITSLTLAPGDVKTEQVYVGSAAQGPYPYVHLGQGDYSAYARVPSSALQLQSDPVRFTVQ